MIRDSVHKSCMMLLNGGYLLSEPQKLNAIATPNHVTICNGLSNGSISITKPTGGSNSFEYSITPGQWITGTLFPNLSADSYTVTIRDANHPNCHVVLPGTIDVLQPDSLKGKLSVNNVTACFGNSNGQIQIINTSGGRNKFEYSINDGQNW